MACYNQKSNYKKISCVMSFLRIIHGTNYLIFNCLRWYGIPDEFFVHIVLYKLERVSMLQSFSENECNFNIFFCIYDQKYKLIFFHRKTFLNDVITEVKDL